MNQAGRDRNARRARSTPGGGDHQRRPRAPRAFRHGRGDRAREGGARFRAAGERRSRSPVPTAPSCSRRSRARRAGALLTDSRPAPTCVHRASRISVRRAAASRSRDSRRSTCAWSAATRSRTRWRRSRSRASTDSIRPRSRRRSRPSEPAAGRMEVRTRARRDPARGLLQREPRLDARRARDAGGLARDARRRIAVLGDMLELGAEAPALHRETGAAVRGAELWTIGAFAADYAAGAAGAGIPARVFANKLELAAALGRGARPRTWSCCSRPRAARRSRTCSRHCREPGGDGGADACSTNGSIRCTSCPGSRR